MQTIALGLRPRSRGQRSKRPVKAYFGTEKGTVPKDVQGCLKNALAGKNGIELIQSQGNNKKLTDLDPTNPEGVKKQLRNTVGVVINVSDGRNLQQVGEHLIGLGIPLADYPFEKLPAKGEGLICLNKTTEDHHGFNMHLGAVVARNDDVALLSNMMADPGTSHPSEEKLVTMPIIRAEKFLSMNFYKDEEPQKVFAVGLLKVDKAEEKKQQNKKRKREEEEEEAGV
jgi:hypothetical protein